MKRFLMILAIAGIVTGLLALASGCGTSPSADSSNLSKDKYDKVEVGSSTDVLKTIAGEPSKTEAKSLGGSHSMGGGTMTGGSMSMEYWYYQGSNGWVRFEVSDGKVTDKSGY